MPILSCLDWLSQATKTVGCSVSGGLLCLVADPKPRALAQMPSMAESHAVAKSPSQISLAWALVDPSNRQGHMGFAWPVREVELVTTWVVR
jgi:hypothetical protein